MKKLFLDTNIVLDVILGRAEYFDSSAKILSLIDMKKYAGWISSLSCSIIYYITAKHFDKITAMKKLEHFRVKVNISSVTEETVDLALSSDFIDFEDSLQYYSAVDAGCDYIITRDREDFKKSQLPVFTPDEFLSIYRK